MHQLIRGGRDTELQQNNFFQALSQLQHLKILSDIVVTHLREAYIFLRNTEHALQAAHDQQTHVLPTQPAEQDRLAYTLGFEDWTAFLSL